MAVNDKTEAPPEIIALGRFTDISCARESSLLGVTTGHTTIISASIKCDTCGTVSGKQRMCQDAVFFLSLWEFLRANYTIKRMNFTL